MFREQEQDDLILITPKMGHGDFAAWTKENIWNRSRIEDTQGNLVSQGFGKFFNLNGGPEELKITAVDIIKECKKQKAMATLKIDGSLLIRAVYKGKIMLRVRSSFDLGRIDNKHEIELFREKYPKLFDPNINHDTSTLFEWTTPNHQIVIKYDEPKLTLVGGVQHNIMRYLNMEQLDSLAHIFGTPIVEHFNLTESGWKDLVKRLQDNCDIEGYVIRVRDEQSLAKVKSPIYLAKHAFKLDFSINKLIDLWFAADKPENYSDFMNYLIEQFDEEIATWAIPYVSTMYDGINEINKAINHMKKYIAAHETDTQKEIAETFNSMYGSTAKFGIAMALYNRKDYDRGLKKIIRQKIGKWDE